MPTAKILIIDDLERVRELYAIFLSKKGFTILEAKNGKEGLDLVRRHAPALVLLDVMLPDLSGMEVLHKIREMNNDTKVIMLSGLEDDDLKEEACLAGATDFLSKTLDVVEIVEAVSRALL